MVARGGVGLWSGFCWCIVPWHGGEGFHLGEVLVLSGCSRVCKLAEGVTVEVVLLDMGTVGT